MQHALCFLQRNAVPTAHWPVAGEGAATAGGAGRGHGVGGEDVIVTGRVGGGRTDVPQGGFGGDGLGHAAGGGEGVIEGL